MAIGAPMNLEVRVLPSTRTARHFEWQIVEIGGGPIQTSSGTYRTEGDARIAGEAALEGLQARPD